MQLTELHNTCLLTTCRFARIILDEASLFLSDKSNAVSVNLARGRLTPLFTSLCFKLFTNHNKDSFFFFPDYVQVVDMGTLELRITAVKPGVDGKLVGRAFPKHLVCL